MSKSRFDDQDDSDDDNDFDIDELPFGDDPNQCPECGGNLDFSASVNGFCWECDF